MVRFVFPVHPKSLENLGRKPGGSENEALTADRQKQSQFPPNWVAVRLRVRHIHFLLDMICEGATFGCESAGHTATIVAALDT